MIILLALAKKRPKKGLAQGQEVGGMATSPLPAKPLGYPTDRRGTALYSATSCSQSVEESVMRETITISVPEEIKAELDKVVRDEGISRSDVVLESLRDYLFMRRFRRLRAKMLAKAQAQGVFTDEDVFKRVS